MDNVLMTVSEIPNDFKVVNDFLPMIQDVYQVEDTFNFENENDSQTDNYTEMIPYKIKNYMSNNLYVLRD